MLEENIVKIVSRYTVGSVTVYTIWRLFIKIFPQNAEACIHVDTGFQLVMLCIRPFEKTSENENKVEFKGILKISRLVLNYFYKISNKSRLKCTGC